jgi:hypothetical protein
MAEFLARYRKDDNAWWHLETGDMQNLFDEAVEVLERIASYDLTQMRSGVNVAVLQGIARDALYGELLGDK